MHAELRRLSFVAALAVAALPIRLPAYTYTGTKWAGSTITMHLQLGASNGPLSDGNASWGASAEDALSTWNACLGSTKFAVVRDSTAAKAQGNRLNNVFFSSTVYGQAWGSGVLAVTLTFSNSAAQSTECDVLFNSTLGWDSYRGSIRYGSAGAVYDFHRVALHEFGHVLGLDHPDQAGQSVSAVMNSRISNLDTLVADDVAGAQSLYGAPSTSTGTAPVITSQPVSQSVVAGGTATFSVTASSPTSVAYQWLKNGGAIGGATSASLTLNNVTASAAGNYAVMVSNSAGSVTSGTATLTVINPVVAPTVTSQPTSQTASVGGSATFSVTATGTAPLAYAWRKNGVAISGATQATYTLSNIRTTDAATYSVVVSNTAGSVTSNNAALTVTALPSISAASSNQTVSAGESINLSVTASGTPAPSYQWQKNGVNLAGATQSTFVVSAASPSDAGTYTVVVSNSAGSVTSAPAQVTVKYSQLVNLSTRGFVPPGGALTAGFVLRGSADKAILVRGIGPALNSFGVTGTLSDPQLALIAQDSSQTVAQNDSWGQTPQLSSAFQSVGAFALPTGSADSASQVRLLPGSYTTRVTADAANLTGVALAEVYDAEAASYRSRLVNLSTLGYAGSGENALVAGFTVQGNAPKRVLLRAIGPSLAGFGVSGYAANPRLDVYPLGQSTVVAGNDDWAGTTELKSAFSASGAFALDSASRDAAIVLTLDPGGYTVVVTSTGGTTGYALVEVYDLDP